MCTVYPISRAHNVRGMGGTTRGGEREWLSLPSADKVVQLHCATSLNFGCSDPIPVTSHILPPLSSHPSLHFLYRWKLLYIQAASRRDIWLYYTCRKSVVLTCFIYIYTYTRIIFCIKKVWLNLPSQFHTKGKRCRWYSLYTRPSTWTFIPPYRDNWKFLEVILHYYIL